MYLNLYSHSAFFQECRGLLKRFCYCCGGHRVYHIYGKVCNRMCLKIFNLATRSFSEPCHLKSEVALSLKKINNIKTEPFDENGKPKFNFKEPFPQVPVLMPISNIVCSSVSLPPTTENPTVPRKQQETNQMETIGTIQSQDFSNMKLDSVQDSNMDIINTRPSTILNQLQSQMILWNRPPLALRRKAPLFSGMLLFTRPKQVPSTEEITSIKL